MIRCLLLFFIFSIIPAYWILAQPDSVPHLYLNQIRVSGITSKNQQTNPIQIEYKSLNDLQSTPTLNLGDAISKIPGVYAASSGPGIYRPVIRGMQGNRIVSVWNGLRMEGQQWGGDHGLGLSELGIGSIEVIKGPSSLIYGSDALGGVIYFKDEEQPSKNSYRIKAKSQLNTNTKGVVNQFFYTQSKSKTQWHIGARYGNHADYQLPNGKFLENSRFAEFGLNGGLSYNSKFGTHQIKIAYSNFRVGLPGHSHDTLINPLLFQVNTWERRYTIPVQIQQNLFLLNDNRWYLKKNEFQILLGYSKNNLSEFEEKWTIPGINLQLKNSLLQAKWLFNMNEKTRIISGIQSMYQSNSNSENATEFLTPNGYTLDLGIYSLIDWNIQNWFLQLGARADMRTLKTSDLNFISSEYQRVFKASTYALNALYNFGKHQFRVSTSSGYRAPNYAELLSNGIHHGALRFEIGDMNLKPEFANQLDLSVKFNHEHTSLLINPFFNIFRNYIFLNPNDFIISGLPVYTYEQTQKVKFYGIDVALHHHPHFAHGLHTETNFSLILPHGSQEVALLPQPRCTEVIQYTFQSNRKWRIHQLTTEFNWCGKQTNVARFETVSPAYYTIDASVELEFKNTQLITMKLGVKNLTNQTYIDHLSRLKSMGIPMMGRGYFLTLQFDINSKQQ
jgi:iron complex outermembrane receptor protein